MRGDQRMRADLCAAMLHDPTLRLKDSAGENDSYRYVHALHELFGLELDTLAAESETQGAEVMPLAPRRRSRSG